MTWKYMQKVWLPLSALLFRLLESPLTPQLLRNKGHQGTVVARYHAHASEFCWSNIWPHPSPPQLPMHCSQGLYLLLVWLWFRLVFKGSSLQRFSSGFLSLKVETPMTSGLMWWKKKDHPNALKPYRLYSIAPKSLSAELPVQISLWRCLGHGSWKLALQQQTIWPRNPSHWTNPQVTTLGKCPTSTPWTERIGSVIWGGNLLQKILPPSTLAWQN